PADVLRLLRDHPGTLLVAVPEGAVIGTVIAAWDGWRGTIYRLAVLQEHRRRGIARALVEEAVRRLGAAGAKRITALVEGDHPWALAFWDAAGFHRHSGMLRYFKNLP
ncbi:MAG: GNAT family N-acetyltransferase, partial [Candidatus Rokubacteria bacterium]|nr:GNAT family N-acetyltransferase [Candidatus Rokubacteria bacterium]